MREIEGALQKIRSAPLPVHFAGFESDTLRLQNAGWQLSVEQDRDIYTGCYAIHLVGKHEGAATFMYCNPVRLDPGELFHSYREHGYPKHIEFHVAHVAPNFNMRIMTMESTASFRPIDARPEMIESKDVSLEDLAIFKPVNVSEDFEIYLNKKDESEILDLLLQKQDPKQKEIRENRRHRAWKEKQSPATETANQGYDPYGDISRQLVVVSG